MQKRIFIISLFFINLSSFAQLKRDTSGWIPPVDIPIYLSGNFAELRTGHFHAGIDIKTQGNEGFKVYAVQDGYISRIKVSSGGYGKAVYITHPDSYTSVYGHLKEYNIQLDKYVKAIQYERKSYGVDIFPEKGELAINQGDIIGLSGNSGSSGGPHLHFEIRDTKSARPMNGLFLGYDIEDNIPPKMDYLYVYPQYGRGTVNGKSKDHYYSLKRANADFALRQGDTLTASGSVGLGLKVNDYLNGSANRCGVYELKGFIDDTLFFYEKFDGFSFAETRYINSLMDYKENIDKKRKLHKMYIAPNNNLSVYVDAVNRGVLDFSEPNSVNKIRIEATDAHQNKSELMFFIKTVNASTKLLAKKRDEIVIPWQHEFTLDTLGLMATFAEKSFYDTLFMDFSVDTTKYPNTYSSIYYIHNSYTPIHNYYYVSIVHDSVADSLQSKLLLGLWYKERFSALGGVAKNGKVEAQVRKLGTITVVMDTTPPIIKALGALESTSDLSKMSTLEFKIEDDFSGIASYSGTINGNWVLFEYDAKNDLITYEFDEYMPTEGFVEVVISVIDERGNTSFFEKDCEIYPEQDHDIGQ